MSITKLKVNNDKYLYIDNNNLKVYDFINHYDYNSEGIFIIGKNEFCLRTYVSNLRLHTYLDIEISESECLHFELSSSKITQDFINNPNYKNIYLKPITNILDIPKTGYRTIVFSEYEIKNEIFYLKNDLDQIFEHPFGILIFNSKGELAGVASNCMYLYDINLDYCNDSKLSTLVRFNDIEDICKSILKP